MKRQSLYFTGQRQVQVREEEIHAPKTPEIRLSSLASLISAGSEMLVYRNELSPELPMKEVLPGLEGRFGYPLKFGYSIVGRQDEAAGKGSHLLQGQRFFALNPHESHFNTLPKRYLLVPEDCPTEDAIFLANMETAISVVMDADPGLGEKIVVIGLGVVGLLTSALLQQHPLSYLAALDPLQIRREAAQEHGLAQLFDPRDEDQFETLKSSLGKRGADTVIELSSQPEALNLAMQLVGPQGKIVVASWYGQRRSELDLGSHFHQGRVQIISSHVGKMNPAFRGRWGRKRRFSLAWDWLKRIQPSKWITHSFPLAEAAQAYRLIDQQPERCIALALEYE